MNRLYYALPLLFSLFVIELLFSGDVPKEKPAFIEMTVHDFMEDYTKPATKLARKGKKEKLVESLKVMPSMALESQKEDWEKIVNKALSSGDYKASCKSCHSKYKKKYKKTYRKRLVKVPSELLELFKK
ncbi:MAG: hypothetical protein KDK45_23930 [Leptospiraceae bacterium]|nr:hypothetical protein [Leptospiraceae bacterium]